MHPRAYGQPPNLVALLCMARILHTLPCEYFRSLSRRTRIACTGDQRAEILTNEALSVIGSGWHWVLTAREVVLRFGTRPARLMFPMSRFVILHGACDFKAHFSTVRISVNCSQVEPGA